MATTFDNIIKGMEAVGPILQKGMEWQQERSRYNTKQEEQRKAAQMPGLSAEEAYMARNEGADQITPQPQMEWKKQDTMTPFQKTMSNLALAASIPGQVQQVMPGLMPALSKVPGVGRVTDLFRPDMSYLDAQADQEREKFRRETLPRILEFYGDAPGSQQAEAVRQGVADLEERLTAMRAQAYEKGLQSQNQASDRLLNLGMQPQFQLAQGVKEEASPYQKALSVKDPITGEMVTLDKFAETIAGGKDMKLGAQFKAALEKASPEQAIYMKKVLEKYTDRKSIPPFVKALKTPEAFEAYYQMTNHSDPTIQAIAKKAEKALSANGRKDMEALYKAVKSQDKRMVDKLARRYGIKEPSGAWLRNLDTKLIGGIAAPAAVMGAAAFGPAAVAKGAMAASSLVGSILGLSKKEPTKLSDIQRQTVKNAVTAQALRR